LIAVNFFLSEPCLAREKKRERERERERASRGEGEGGEERRAGHVPFSSFLLLFFFFLLYHSHGNEFSRDVDDGRRD